MITPTFICRTLRLDPESFLSEPDGILFASWLFFWLLDRVEVVGDDYDRLREETRETLVGSDNESDIVERISMKSVSGFLAWWRRETATCLFRRAS